MGKSILVIEDDEDIRESLQQVLEMEGYDVVPAGNGREGLAALSQAEPCVILLDLMMPVMNGWEFRREQLSDSLLASIPTVIVTAYVGPIPNGLGEAPKVRKPVKPEQLISLVETYCPKRGGAPDAVA